MDVGESMNNRERALELLESADEETLWQMFRYLHNERFIDGHIFAILNINNDKSLKEFIEFFGMEENNNG